MWWHRVVTSAVQGVRPDSGIALRPAVQSSEYRAAAFLRAQSFYTYPSDRSEYARRSHLRMKADEMWQHLEEGTSHRGDNASEPIVVPLIATATTLQGAPVASFLDDASVAIPTEVGGAAGGVFML